MLNSFLIFKLNAKTVNLIKLDTSMQENKCNDYLDRLLIKINFLNNTNENSLLTNNQFYLKYRADQDCQPDNNCNQFKILKMFQYENSSIKTILNSFYKYQFQIVKVNNMSNNILCNDEFEFVKFGHCEQYDINISNNLTCSYFHHNLKLFSVVPYIYIVIGGLVGLTIIAKFCKMLINKYQRIS